MLYNWGKSSNGGFEYYWNYFRIYFYFLVEGMIIMKIIVLYGHSNSGKSTTINQVVDSLVEEVTKTSIKFGSENDFEAQFQYKINVLEFIH